MSELTESGTSKFVELDGVKIHYHDAGKGETLVLLHGGGPGASSWSNFKGNIDELSQKYRVIMMDQPGFGKSGRPIYEGERIGSFAARTLRNLLGHLDIDKAHLIGNSMGGHVSMKFAIDHPEMTGKLILMAPAIQINFLTPAPTEGAKHLFGYYRGTGPSPDKMRSFLHTLVYDQSMVTDELVQARYEISAEPSTVEWTKKMFASQDRFEPLWRELDKIPQQTLLLWGRDDRVVPFERGVFMVQALPNAELHVVSRCGHWVMIEHPKLFNRLCLEFLER
jgi:4,5:9,10-diseco-3-hydroxy-5,9,17-trioxoandrosta-1(10),2-diene-4-oate hydrolase